MQLVIRWVGLIIMMSSFAAVPAARAADVMIPKAPSIAGTGYVLMDAATGTYLMEENADGSLPPASLTKIMTSYLIARELHHGRVSEEEMVPVSVRAWRAEGSRMFIREGTEVPVGALTRGIIIQSGNDASIAMAEYIGGSEDAFADLMNEQARELGMESSNFVNATGLPDEMHYTTARDLAQLTRSLIADFPEHYALYSEKEFTWNDITQNNRNRLLWRDRYVDGVKTGYTSAAGYCLVSSAVRNDMRLISVVLGTNSDEARMRETQKMLAWGFRYFQSASFYEEDRVLLEPQVWLAAESTAPVGLEESIKLTIPRGHYEDIERQLSVDEIIRGPLARGDVVGELKLLLDGEVLATRPVVVLEDIEGANFLVAMWHAIYLFFVQLFS